MSHDAIILFDGVCNLCNGAVNFIIDRDTHKKFRFAALQSDAGKKLTTQLNITNPGEPESVLLIENNRYYSHSTAALKIAKELSGIWKLAYGIILVPKPVRDFIYRFIAKNRYRWFGKQAACRIPTPELKERFLT